VLELNKRMGVAVVKQGNAYNVFVGNGVLIVVGKNAYAIAVRNSPTDPGHL
jgi:flagellar hook-associated protein 1 FlgK